MHKPFPPAVKLMLDLGPLAVFFVIYRLKGGSEVAGPEGKEGLMAATGALIVATLLSLAIQYWKERKLSPMPLVTGIGVTIFGTLTIVLNDELFIKMKPTIVNLLFALALLGGHIMGKPTLKYLLASAIALTEEGWRKLSLRWGVFFVFLAIVNEAVWRNFSTDFWVDFKVFGMLTLTMIFTAAQVPLIKKYMIEEEQPG